MRTTVSVLGLMFMASVMVGIPLVQAADGPINESERTLWDCPDQVGFTRQVVEKLQVVHTSPGLQSVQTTQTVSRIEGNVGVDGGVAWIGRIPVPYISINSNLGGPCIGYKKEVQEFIQNRGQKSEQK